MGLDPRALSAKRLGVFGGTFDPVHNGHLHVARVALEHAGIDHIVFIPARQSPHKQAGAAATGMDRLEMLRLAIASDAYLAHAVSIWDFELHRDGPSFTVRTLEELTRLRGHGEPSREERSLVFLMGSDQFFGLPKWTEVERVFSLARPCVVLRGGEIASPLDQLKGELSDALLADVKEGFLQPEPVELAATELRGRLAEKSATCDAADFPQVVGDYIAARGLYLHDSESVDDTADTSANESGDRD